MSLAIAVLIVASVYAVRIYASRRTARLHRVIEYRRRRSDQKLMSILL